MKSETGRHGKYAGHSKTYVAVWLALLVLTVVTVIVSYYDFGVYNILVAMGVATVKGALVCLYFMHLKYDNRVNQVVFVSAFFFLAVFVGLTASDLLTRFTERAPNISAPQETVDTKVMMAASSENVAKGKAIYSVQCSVCHGATGKGDGPGGIALQPPPKNFTSGIWRYGGGLFRVVKTISEGSPGTGMPGFTNLSLGERFALAHYVRSLGPSFPEDKPEELAAIQIELKMGVGGAADGAQPTGQSPAGETKPSLKLPVRFVMKQMTERRVVFSDRAVVSVNQGMAGLGERLYQQHCLSCHGVNGKGGIPVAMVRAYPAVYLRTRDFSEAGNGLDDKNQFIERVSKGIPGRGKSGIANFSAQEWDELYPYVKSLRSLSK